LCTIAASFGTARSARSALRHCHNNWQPQTRGINLKGNFRVGLGSRLKRTLSIFYTTSSPLFVGNVFPQIRERPAEGSRGGFIFRGATRRELNEGLKKLKLRVVLPEEKQFPEDREQTRAQMARLSRLNALTRNSVAMLLRALSLYLSPLK